MEHATIMRRLSALVLLASVAVQAGIVSASRLPSLALLTSTGASGSSGSGSGGDDAIYQISRWSSYSYSYDEAIHDFLPRGKHPKWCVALIYTTQFNRRVKDELPFSNAVQP